MSRVLTSFRQDPAGGGGLVSSGVSAVVNETTLLVLKMERTALGSDSFSLYVNPALGN